MVDCSVCGKKLGLLSIKMRSDDGAIMCNSCFEKSETTHTEDNKKVMLDFISKYLVTKEEMKDAISKFCKYKDVVDSLFDNHSLSRARDYFQEYLHNVESLNKSGLSSYEIDEIIEAKKTCEDALYFLNDLEKMYKLFRKKEINTNFFEIISIFSEVIENDFNKESDRILLPFYKRISNRLGDNITKEKVIRELMKSPVYNEREWSTDVEFVIVSKLLDKFNLKYEEIELVQLIKKVREEIELEEFEQDLGLGSSKKIDIGDFTKLNGYEFEEYLKNLFELLGYTVLKTSLSGDQGADLIISQGDEKTVVQAKKYNGSVSNKAVQEIATARNHYKASKAIVVTNSSFTKSAIELALSNNVELWDGQKLKNIINSIKNKKDEKSIIPENVSLQYDKGKDSQKIEIKCPFCETKFNHDLNTRDLSVGVTLGTKCPHCDFDVTITANSIKCHYCSEQFDTITKKLKHEETCEKRVSN